MTVHVRGETACFECNPKPVPKSHPICTLRDTPDKPIHCIVYAADLLFPRLFSADPNAKSDLDEEDAVELSAFTRKDGESGADYAVRVFDFVFRYKIERLLEKEEMWKTRARPTSLPSFAELVPEGAAAAAAGSDPTLKALTACKSLVGLSDPNKVWSVADAARVFVSSAARILARDEGQGTEKFDKDDALAVEFVTATAVLRSSNYNIPPQCLFDAKGMAGNIVHAVATTNAIVGGLIVVEALKVLRARKSKKDAPTDAPEPPCCAYKYTFVKQHKSNNRLLEPIDPDTPNPKCVVCGNARLELVCDVESLTLGELLDGVLKKKVGMNMPEIEGPNTTLYLGEDDLDEDEIELYARNKRTTLNKLPAGGVTDGMILSVSDFSQSFNFELKVTHRPAAEWDEEEEPERYELRGDVTAAAAAGNAADDENGDGGDDDDDDDDIVVEDVDDLEVIEDVDDAEAGGMATGKRKRGEEGGADTSGNAKAVRLD